MSLFFATLFYNSIVSIELQKIIKRKTRKTVLFYIYFACACTVWTRQSHWQSFPSSLSFYSPSSWPNFSIIFSEKKKHERKMYLTFRVHLCRQDGRKAMRRKVCIDGNSYFLPLPSHPPICSIFPY